MKQLIIPKNICLKKSNQLTPFNNGGNKKKAECWCQNFIEGFEEVGEE